MGKLIFLALHFLFIFSWADDRKDFDEFYDTWKIQVHSRFTEAFGRIRRSSDFNFPTITQIARDAGYANTDTLTLVLNGRRLLPLKLASFCQKSYALDQSFIFDFPLLRALFGLTGPYHKFLAVREPGGKFRTFREIAKSALSNSQEECPRLLSTVPTEELVEILESRGLTGFTFSPDGQD